MRRLPGSRYWTLTLMATSRVEVEAVARKVTVLVPTGAVAAAVRRRREVKPDEELAGLQDAVTPVGRLIAES